MLRIDAGDAAQVPVAARALRRPVGATVGGGDERAGAAHVAAVAHRPAVVCVDEADRVHRVPVCRKGLLVPGHAAVAGHEDGPGGTSHGVARDRCGAGRPAVACIDEVDTGEPHVGDGVELPGAAAIARGPGTALAQRVVDAQHPAVACIDEIDHRDGSAQVPGRPGQAAVARVGEGAKVCVLRPHDGPEAATTGTAQRSDVHPGDAGDVKAPGRTAVCRGEQRAAVAADDRSMSVEGDDRLEVVALGLRVEPLPAAVTGAHQGQGRGGQDKQRQYCATERQEKRSRETARSCHLSVLSQT